MLVGECDNIAGELAEAQAMMSELNKERDELSARRKRVCGRRATTTEVLV